MEQECSYDVVSDVDRQELVNAVDQTRREITTRYDFKNVPVEITLEAAALTILTASEGQLRSILDVLQTKVHRRGIDIKVLDAQKPEPAAKGNVRQLVKQRKGAADAIARRPPKPIRSP